MTTLFTFAATPLATGQTPIPQTAITGYTQSLSCLLLAVGADALAWASAATQVDVALEVSYDGGLTWLHGGEAKSTGGPASPIAALQQFGGIYTYSAVPTHVRGTITVANGPLSLSGQITTQ